MRVKEGATMQVKIVGWNSPDSKGSFVNIHNIWISPDAQYVVIGQYHSELFIFAKVLENSTDGLICSFLESYYPTYHSVDLRSYDVDWSFLPLGFCKLLRTEFDSGFCGTDRRFYINKKRRE